MGRKSEIVIKTKSFVKINGELVEFCTLPEAQKEEIRKDLLCRYLNELYRGKAVFSYPEKK